MTFGATFDNNLGLNLKLLALSISILVLTCTSVGIIFTEESLEEVLKEILVSTFFKYV